MERKPKNIYTAFPGGKHKVLTLSYDDGKVADRRLVALLNEYGVKGTFNVNTGLERFYSKEYYEERIPITEYKELYKGHEVACLHRTVSCCHLLIYTSASINTIVMKNSR